MMITAVRGGTRIVSKIGDLKVVNITLDPPSQKKMFESLCRGVVYAQKKVS